MGRNFFLKWLPFLTILPEANAGNKNYNFLCEFKVCSFFPPLPSFFWAQISLFFLSFFFFQETDKLGLEPCAFGEEYDIVTCMFAIHYFFENETIALTFLSNVADNLKVKEEGEYLKEGEGEGKWNGL